MEIYAPENVKFVLLFARGFPLCRHEDTHLNEIVLLFNGDVNYSAVKTSPEIYSNLERVELQQQLSWLQFIVWCLISFCFPCCTMWIAAFFCENVVENEFVVRTYFDTFQFNFAFSRYLR